MKATDIYEQITNTIVASIEAGDLGSWKAPWHGDATLPRNAATGATYQGGNVIVLWVTAIDKAYPTNTWATYKQWESLGAQVRKGESGTGAIKWITADKAKRKNDADDVKRSAFPSAFYLFNAAQVDGYVEPERTAAPDVIDHAESFFASIGARIVGGEPSYTPSLDVISLPPLASFDDAVGYYSTSAHEHSHWTGHKSRLDRDLSTRFGSEAYAAEELVAELSAAFVCATLGISTSPRPDHAQYLKSWLRLFKDDPKALYAASSIAQRAANYLVALAAQTQEVAA